MKIKRVVIIALAWLGAGLTHSLAWQADNGDGTYKNPVLYADYPDPDIIRVEEDYYMVSSTFVDSPGLNVLHSKDLVNWELVAHAADEVNGGERFNLVGGAEYRHGFWAPSIRYHDGTFYIVDNPTFGHGRIYYATNISGPWQYHEFNRGTYDPGFFIDADGTGYIVCGNTRLELLTLNSNYSQIVSATHLTNISGIPGIEGSHLLKRGKYYYLFNAVPSRMPFQLKCSRATNIFGPYETITSLNATTGGHQGAIVDTANGGWYGFVMKDSGAVGRMTYISPVFWTNDWPVWGTPEAPGKVPAVARKPVQGQPILQPATSDEFSGVKLGLQWQWNHNPDKARWSLTARPGYLRLASTPATNFWFARNTLTQKGQGPWSRGVVKLDLAGLKPGDICGFGTLGKYNGHIAVHCGDNGKLFLSMEVAMAGGSNETRVASLPISAGEILLRTDLDFIRDRGTCAYSLDGKEWANLGGEFPLRFDWQFGTFQGQKFAIFCFNPQTTGGFVDVDWFHFSDLREKAGQAAAPIAGPSSRQQAQGTGEDQAKGDQKTMPIGQFRER